MVMTDRPYLSIGEVLGLLLEEFPDLHAPLLEATAERLAQLDETG